MSEKVGGAEGTKLDEDFTEMEKARLNSFMSCENSDVPAANPNLFFNYYYQTLFKV